MYGKYTLFYESPKNWGYLHACANSVYQASHRGGGGGGGPGNEANSYYYLLSLPMKKPIVQRFAFSFMVGV